MGIDKAIRDTCDLVGDGLSVPTCIGSVVGGDPA